MPLFASEILFYNLMMISGVKYDSDQLKVDSQGRVSAYANHDVLLRKRAAATGQAVAHVGAVVGRPPAADAPAQAADLPQLLEQLRDAADVPPVASGSQPAR